MISTDLNNSDTKFNKFIMKIFNASETKDQSWYNNINNMVTLAGKTCSNEFKLPIPVQNIKNGCTSILYDISLKSDAVFTDTTSEDLLQSKFVTSTGDGIYVQHMVRLTEYIPGKVVDVKNMDSELAFSFGKCSALVSSSLKVDYQFSTSFDKFIYYGLYIQISSF